MPHYYFDIKDGHRFVEPSGSDLKNDDAAIAKAKVLAIGGFYRSARSRSEAAHCCFEWITGANF